MKDLKMEKLKASYSRLCILISGIMLMLSGCSDNKMYDRYFSGTGEMENGLPFWFNTVKGIYDHLRQWLVLLILLSIVTGLFILKAFSKRNKKLKKLAIFGFLIEIPIILICIFFGMAFALNKYY